MKTIIYIDLSGRKLLIYIVLKVKSRERRNVSHTGGRQ